MAKGEGRRSCPSGLPDRPFGLSDRLGFRAQTPLCHFVTSPPQGGRSDRLRPRRFQDNSGYGEKTVVCPRPPGGACPVRPAAAKCRTSAVFRSPPLRGRCPAGERGVAIRQGSGGCFTLGKGNARRQVAGSAACARAASCTLTLHWRRTPAGGVRVRSKLLPARIGSAAAAAAAEAAWAAGGEEFFQVEEADHLVLVGEDALDKLR